MHSRSGAATAAFAHLTRLGRCDTAPDLALPVFLFLFDIGVSRDLSRDRPLCQRPIGL
jgi:hypothetical protein